MKYFIILLVLSGCGLVKYNSTLTLPDGEKVHLESNVPAVAEGAGYKIDQRTISFFERLAEWSWKSREVGKQ